MLVLVTGGTGVVGRPAVTELVRRGHRVRLLSRNADRDAGDWAQGVEAFAAHIGDADSLRGAAEGCDAVLHVAGIAAEQLPDSTFERVNVEGTRNLLAEAERSGAPRFVYVSSLGADRGESAYHRSKFAGEGLVRGYAGPWLILRPGNVYGPGDDVISLLLKMVRTLPAIPLIGMGDQPFQPISAEDAGLALALAVEQERRGQALDLAGDEVVTTAELLDRLESLTGRTPARVPVPEWMAAAGTSIGEALGLDVRITTDQITMLREGNVVPPGGVNALREVFGVEPVSLDDGLARLADALPERLPAEGTGTLRRHRYWADIEGSGLDAEGLIDLVRREMHTLTDPELIRLAAEPGSRTELEVGATLTIDIPLRGHIQVRVEEVQPREITGLTLEGHPLSGAIRFLADNVADRMVHFEVRTYTRASSLPDLIAMSTMGESMKGAAWHSLVEAVVARSGGVAPRGVESTVEELEDPSALEDLEEWAEALVRRRRRKEAGR